MQRQLAKPKARKEPVSSDMIAMLVYSLSARLTPTDVRLVAECLLAFSAFLRYDELAKLRCCDVTFCATHMSVHITSSKTDQYRQGENVVMTRTGSPTCPGFYARAVFCYGISITAVKNCVSFVVLWFLRVRRGLGHNVLSGHCTIRWTLYYCIDRTEPLTYYTYSCMYACADIHHAQLLYTLLRDILKVYPATSSSKCVLALSSMCIITGT